MAYANLTPNLQDMFSQINDRLRKLESGPNSAAYSADTAQSTANSAQSAATTALANAATAYTAAQNSLQPSAYAIQDPTTKQLTAINSVGVTVYTNSPTTGARVVMNSNGLAGYNASGGTTFAISASDGSAHFAGSITGSSITGSTLNINGNFVVDGTGLMTCTGASVTGSLYSTNGTIGGFNISSYSLSNSSGTIQILSSGNGQISLAGEIFAGSVNIGGQNPPTSGLGVYGASTFGGYIYNTGYATTTSSANAYINSSTGLLARSSSSLRYKLDVEPQVIPVQSILQLQPKSFIDKASADAQDGKTDGLPRILGLIAEEIAQIPVLADLLMNKNEQGEPDSVNYDRVAVALLPLLQDHEARLAKLEGK